MSIFKHLHIRIRESILSISLSSRLSRVIGQSPYQSRVLAVTSRCVYRPSVVQLLVWVFMCVCLVAFYLSLHCSRVSLRAHPILFHNMFKFLENRKKEKTKEKGKYQKKFIIYYFLYFPFVFPSHFLIKRAKSMKKILITSFI